MFCNSVNRLIMGFKSSPSKVTAKVCYIIMDKINYTISVPKDDPNYWKIFVVIAFIDQGLEKVDLQVGRIKDDLNRNDLKTLFSDIHFFLVSVSNLQELLKHLRSIISKDAQYAIIYKKYIKELEHLNNFRDHLEHITDGRLEGRGKKGIPLKKPNMFGNIINENYDFCGETFNIAEALKLPSQIKNELIEWNKKSNRFPVWNLPNNL